MEKPQIKVFVTKTGKFRAKIKENNTSETYEVTVGGSSWFSGKGRQFEEIILTKCGLILSGLDFEFNNIQDYEKN